MTKWLVLISLSFNFYSYSQEAYVALEEKTCYQQEYCHLGKNAERIKTTDFLILFGKGVRGKKSNHVIAPICLDSNVSNCDTIRFAYFAGEMEAYWVGPLLTLKKTSKKSGKKVSLNYALKKSIQHFNDYEFGGNAGISAIVGGAAWTSSIILGLAGGPILLTGGAFAFGFTAVVGNSGSNWGRKLDPTRIFKRRLAIISHKQMVSMKGWNWQSDPMPVKEKYLEKFVLSIREFTWKFHFEEYFEIQH